MNAMAKTAISGLNQKSPATERVQLQPKGPYNDPSMIISCVEKKMSACQKRWNSNCHDGPANENENGFGILVSSFCSQFAITCHARF